MRASWVMLVLALCGSVPAGRALCWQSSICSDLRSKERLLDCISMCASRGPAVLPTERSPGQYGLLVDLLLSSLGDPRDPPPAPPGRGEDRRSYAMEHFRWGKPAGKKRRPVKVHAISGEEGGGGGGGDVSAEAGYRRKGGGGRQRRPAAVAGGVAGEEEGGDGEEEVVVLDARDLPTQGATAGPQTGSRSSSQGTKDPATYRMSHFRWGSPAKRRHGYPPPWEETHKRPLSRFFGSSFKLVQ